jgi:hypothetical protein
MLVCIAAALLLQQECKAMIECVTVDMMCAASAFALHCVGHTLALRTLSCTTIAAT